MSAAASVALHLHERGRSLDVVAAGMSLPGSSTGMLLDRLARLTTSNEAGLNDALAQAEANGRDANLVAILGSLDEPTVRLLSTHHRSQGSALALLLDTVSWTAPNEATQRLHEHASRRAAAALTGAGWRVQRVTREMSIADAWSALMNQMSPGTAPAAAPPTAGTRAGPA